MVCGRRRCSTSRTFSRRSATRFGKYHQLASDQRAIKNSYLQLLVLITLFILFFATWLALFLSKQISVPITALLAAAQEIRRGNLGTKVQVGAVDELASLVRAFNEMSLDLEANSRELENRRRFTEAILESIPTGVISLTSDGRVQRVNRALKGLLGVDAVNRAQPPGGPVHAGRYGRDSLPDESRAAHERRGQPDRDSRRAAGAASVRDGLGAR